MEEFLATLLHFQHFRQFINNKIDQLKNRSVNRDLFDIEAMYYDEGMYIYQICTHTCIITTHTCIKAIRASAYVLINSSIHTHTTICTMWCVCVALWFSI